MQKLIFSAMFCLFELSLSGQFAPEYTFADDTSRSYHAQSIDIDNDGDLDLVAGLYKGLVVYENLDGLGNFDCPQFIDDVNHEIENIHIADLNMDGALDVLATTGNRIIWYSNDGNGNFASPILVFQDGPSVPLAISVDIDNDGDLDILSGRTIQFPSESYLSYFLNDGTGAFGSENQIDTGEIITDIHAIDLDDDGDQDLMATFSATNEVIYYENEGSLVFNKIVLNTDFAFEEASSVCTGDLDNDGDLDILATARDLATGGYWFENVGINNFTPHAIFGGESLNDVNVADLTGDGILEILYIAYSYAGIASNNGDNTFSEETITERLYSGQIIQSADFNGDGNQDLYTVDENSSRISWYPNDGTGQFGSEQLISELLDVPRNLGFIDLNNDGIKDVICQSHQNAVIFWQPTLSDGSFGKPQMIESGHKAIESIAVGDVDNDGKDDLLAVSDSLLFFKNTGNGLEKTPTATVLFNPWESKIVLGDLDSDGDLDFIASHNSFSFSGHFLYKNDGTGNFSFETELFSDEPDGGDDKNPIIFEDVNGDGHLDVLKSGLLGLVLFFNQGDGTTYEKHDLAFNGETRTLFDLDNDGDLDLIIMTSSNVQYFENETGDGLFSNFGGQEIATGFFQFATFLDFVDLNNDGLADMLFGSRKHGSIQYLLQQNDGSFSPTFDLLAPNLFNTENSFTYVYPVDFFQDGDLDIVFSSTGNNGNNHPGRLGYFQNVSANTSLSGVVYWDENQNGIFDANESIIPNIPVQSTPNTFFAYTDLQGAFHIYTNQADTFTVAPQPQACWELTTDSVSIYFDGINEVDNLQFGMTPIGGEENLRINLTAAPTRCGFTVPFWLSIANEGCQTATGRYQLTLSDMATFLQADPMPDEIDGTTLFWDYNQLFPGQQQQVKLEFEIAGVEFLGDYVTMPTTILAEDTQGTLVVADEFLFESQINCSYDPNDKAVLPNRLPADGFDQNYTLFDENLLYTIRFQNTGTDTAFNIVIRDQLSSDLDWSTFQPGNASHPFEATISTTGLVEFHFRNILLPDSLTNEPGSHGFVNFQIVPNTGLPEMTSIENTAGIYFDFNPPIITNTVDNVFVSDFPYPVANFSWMIEEAIVDFQDLSTNNPTSWQWDFGDGNGSDLQNPTHTYLESGDYEVCLEVTNGLGSHTTCQTLQIIINSTNSLNPTIQVDLHPNPAKDVLYLTLPSTTKNYSWQIKNTFGQVVDQQISTTSKAESIAISNLPSGVYFMEIVDLERSNQMVVRKFVKE